MGIDPANVDSLKDVPFERLDMAGKKALAEVKISWAPVKDGETIPKDPVKGGFSDLAKDIPLMAGSVLNEWISVPLVVNMAENQSDNKNFWDDAETSAKLRERFGDKADKVTAAFLKAYPWKKAGDSLYVDTWLRLGAIETLNTKAKQPAPVYAYIFTWETPIMGGYAVAYHCSELPFVFNNIALSEKTTGGGEKAQALADKISQAWIDFARTGNPGWEAYTPENGATMIFDDAPVLGNHHDAELLKLLTE